MNRHVGYVGALLALLLAALAACSTAPTRAHTARADDVGLARSDDDSYGAFPYGYAPFVYRVESP